MDLCSALDHISNPQGHDDFSSGGGDVGHSGGRGATGGGGAGHHDDGEDHSFNGDDFTHFEREFRGGIQPTADYYDDIYAGGKFTLTFKA